MVHAWLSRPFREMGATHFNNWEKNEAEYAGAEQKRDDERMTVTATRGCFGGGNNMLILKTAVSTIDAIIAMIAVCVIIFGVNGKRNKCIFSACVFPIIAANLFAIWL